MAIKNADERLEDKKKRQKTIIIGAAVFLALIILAAVFIVLNGGGPGANTATYVAAQVDATGQNVLIPLADISDNSFHFYSYNATGVTIKYFVVKDENDNIHTAFDACDVCYAARKGYRQDGDYAKCNNCGKSFYVSDIGTKNTGGGCWPGNLPHQVQGGNIVISSTDLAGGKHYFA